MSILLYDPATNYFMQRQVVKYGESVQGKFHVAPTEGLIGAAATSRMPVCVPDVSQDPRYIMVNPETRSELAIPMIHKGSVMGVLDLESPQLNYFTGEHVQALSILAAQLAVALENAGLYEKVARDEARMERELLAAQRIQGALLRPVPADDYGVDLAARILSARGVCGDLYDFLRYGPTRLGFALGDVSGKGSAAALYGAVAIGILRSMVPLKLFPAELLRQLNQLICERRIEGRFMTMCFATWGKSSRKLRVANAGQSQPLLLRRGRCEQLNLVGFPLGIFEDVTYEEWSVVLDPGDTLVLYSDGLSEAANPQGQQFGVPRLAGFIEGHCPLTAGELADRLTAEVQEFTQGAPLQDDQTLVVMKVR
jgi:sigma-B regulation protein RsbU (phosphoserine phosphatase)